MWIRFLISGAIVIPAGLVHVPWWQLLLIAAGGFASGRIVELGVTGLDSAKRRQAALVLAGGLALGLGTFAIGVWPRLHPHPASREAYNRLPEVPTPAPVSPPRQRPGTWTAVSIRDRMACALRADGTVWCWGLVPGWGYYSIGEPRQVPGLANATAIAVGATSTCALIAGQAWCFGWNYDGSLGVPPTDSHDLRTEPVRVPLPAPLVAIAAGSGLACALGAAGEVWCWGNINRTGVRFTDEIAREAAEVRGPTRIAVPAARAIAAGHDAGCAIAREGGALVCWGELAARGSFGGATRYLAPTAIAGIADATTIAISGLAFCALQRASPPTCWGTGPAMDDRLAQIEALRADGKLPAVRPHVNAARLAPYYDAVGVRNEAVASARAVLATDPDPRALHGHAELAGASALAVGELHACAVVDAEVRCWGANYAGRLGDGTRTDSRLRAVDVAELPPVTQLAIGELESCALTAAGALWCWGHEELPN